VALKKFANDRAAVVRRGRLGKEIFFMGGTYRHSVARNDGALAVSSADVVLPSRNFGEGVRPRNVRARRSVKS
jgi:hypothetical protein